MIVKKRKKSHKILLTGVSALILMQGSVMPAYAGGAADGGGGTTSTSTSTGGTALDPLELALMSDTGSSSEDKVTNASGVTVKGNNKGGTVKFYVDDLATDVTEKTEYTDLSGLKDGRYSVTATEFDANNTVIGQTSAPLTITVDKTAPTVAGTSIESNANGFTYSGTTEAGATVWVDKNKDGKVDTGETATAEQDGIFSITGITSGVNAVKITDIAGNKTEFKINANTSETIGNSTVGRTDQKVSDLATVTKAQDGTYILTPKERADVNFLINNAPQGTRVNVPLSSTGTTTISANAPHTQVNFTGVSTGQILNITGDVGGMKLTGVAAYVQAGKTLTVNGDVYNSVGALQNAGFIIDPSYFYVPRTSSSITYGNVTFGSETDTYNALILEPGATFTAQSLTIMNDAILILSYDPADLSNLSVGTKTLINGPVNKAFKYVWKVVRSADPQAKGDRTTLTDVSNGSLGQTSLIMNVDQSDLNNIQLIVTDAGSKVASSKLVDKTLLDEIFSKNPVLEKFLFGSVSSKPTTVVNEVSVANATLGALSLNKGTDIVQSVGNINNFRSSIYKSLRANTTTVNKLDRLSRALSESGPMQVDNEQLRLWVAPYLTIGNDSENQSKKEGFGALLGAEYRDLKRRATFAGFVGLNTDNQDSRVQEKEGFKTKGFVVGSYGFFNPWYDGRVDATYIYAQNRVKHNDFNELTQGVDSGKFRSHIHTFDTMFSQVYRIPGDVWSIRGNVGHTVVYSKSGSYMVGTQEIESRRGTSQEVYSGVGLRWNRRGDTRIRITGVYEYGYEYRHTMRTPKVVSHGVISVEKPGQAVGKSRTHYLSGNISFLNKSNWKLILAYNGSYSGKEQDHVGMAKVEYRW